MKEKQSNSNIYIKHCEQLPEWCFNYVYIGLSEKSSSTRIEYVRDILYFFKVIIQIIPEFKDKQIQNITLDDIKKITASDINLFLLYMKDNNISETTRARRKSSISMLFSYLINTERKLKYNPVDGALKVKIPEKDFVIYLTLEEQEKLLNGIISGKGLTDRELKLHHRYINRDIAIIFLFLDTGIRISELHGINIHDIDFSECSIIIRRKGNKFVKIWFSDESKYYLQTYLEERKNLNQIIHGEDPVFVTLKEERLSIRAIQILLNKYMRANLPAKANIISVHKLRSSFAMTFYKMTNGDILALQQRLGHKSITTTNIYAKAAELEMKNNRNWRNNLDN